jgi:succinate dehydrogenase/fumarate reductase flavoprotein subunit
LQFCLNLVYRYLLSDLTYKGHIVVDKNKFEEMFKLRVKNQVSIVEEELMEKNAKYVTQLKTEANDLFNEERGKVREILKVVINQQFDTLQKSLQTATEKHANNPEDLKKSVEEALQTYKRVIDVVLSDANQSINKN